MLKSITFYFENPTSSYREIVKDIATLKLAALNCLLHKEDLNRCK